jgi:hypothetical protein
MGVPEPKDSPDLLREEYPPSVCRPQVRYVALCDVLGFTQLMQKYDIQTLAKQYDDMLREAKASCLMVKRYPSPKPWIAERYRAGAVAFSDTILLWSDCDSKERDVSGSFFSYIAGVFSIALKMGFPLRIGIAYGECVINPEAGLFLGKPVVNAHQTEQAQDWVGIGCHRSCFDSPGSKNLSMSYLDGWQCGPLIEYPIPIKTEYSKIVEAKHSIDWPFWGHSDWGCLTSLETILSKTIQKYMGTRYETRWRRAIEYYEFRVSKWKEIERQIPRSAVSDGVEKTSKKTMDSDEK